MIRYYLRELYYNLIKLRKKIESEHLILEHNSKVSSTSSFEGYNKICHDAYFSGDMGYASYIGEYSEITAKIGRYCSIGGRVKVISLTHPVSKFVSTSPCFYSLQKQSGFTYVSEQKFTESLHYKKTKYPVIIEDDVYIGYGAMLIAPIKIGTGAIIAANSTVTKDVPPYTIVAGTPAKEIRKRFTNEEIDFLNIIKWWDKPPSWLLKHANLFEDINLFKEAMVEELQHCEDKGV